MIFLASLIGVYIVDPFFESISELLIKIFFKKITD